MTDERNPETPRPLEPKGFGKASDLDWSPGSRGDEKGLRADGLRAIDVDLMFGPKTPADIADARARGRTSDGNARKR